MCCNVLWLQQTSSITVGPLLASSCIERVDVQQSAVSATHLSTWLHTHCELRLFNYNSLIKDVESLLRQLIWTHFEQSHVKRTYVKLRIETFYDS